MERCPSGLRCMIGNHVDGEYRHGGSNPPLSARKGRARRNRRAFRMPVFQSADSRKSFVRLRRGLLHQPVRNWFLGSSLRQEGFSRHLNHEFAGECREWGRRSIPFLDFIQVLLYFLLIAARIYSILLVTISASREGRKERESGRGNWDTLAAESLLTEGTFLFLPPFGGADSFCLQMGRQRGLECGRIPRFF